jgi:class 3 adenylate cyclase
MSDTPTARFVWTGALADASLEHAYQRDSLDGRRRFVRFSLLVATLAFLSYGVHDALVVPEVRARAWLVRYGVFLPIALAVMALVHSRHFARFGQVALVLYGLSTCFVVFYIAVIAGGAGYFLYSSYAILFVTLGPFVAELEVPAQIAYTLSTLGMYLAFDLALAHTPGTIRLSIGTTLVVLGAIGALVAYQSGRQAREAFLQRRLIREQVATIDAEKSRSETLLLNVLPAPIAERLKRDPGIIAEGHEQVSVLFADIVGFTKMTERIDPNELVDRLNLIFSSFDDLVDKLRLEKIKTIGDAYMVAGGLHSREYDHAEGIAEMALAMRRRFADFGQRFGEPLDIRIGIHTGPVVAGVIGKKKFIYDVWGDTVNTASRMESHAENGKIQVSEVTYQILKERYEFESRGEIEVKGKGAMRTYYLLDHKADAQGRTSAKTRIPRKVK